jgi:hypothetical protein
MWIVGTTRELDDWFRELDDSSKAEVIAKTKLLQMLGPRLGRPHADTLNGSRYANMKELRAHTNDSVLRIAFAFDPERKAILLVGGDKGGVNERRFYQRLIAMADDLYERHLKKLKGNNHG